MAADSLNRFSLDEIAAFNDEILMLSRAGIPLEPGLRRLAADGNKRGNKLAERIATRLESGQSLAESVREERGGFPRLYATLVETGLRTGRLPVALEAISEFSREFADLRRSLFQAMVYPLITVILAYALAIVFVTNAVDQIQAWNELVGSNTGTALRVITWLNENLATWVWIPPALMLSFGFLWFAAGKANVLSLSGPTGWLAFVPGMRGIVQNFRHSFFARLAGVLLRHDIPLPDALTLASGGCGRGMQKAALAFAEADSRGNRDAVTHAQTKHMRPLLRWILRRQQSGDRLIASLDVSGRSYFQKGKVGLRWLQFTTPLLFTLVVGGGLTLLYALGFFLPLTDMLAQMAEMQ